MYWCHANTNRIHAFDGGPGTSSLCGFAVRLAEVNTLGVLTHCNDCLQRAEDQGEKVPDAPWRR